MKQTNPERKIKHICGFSRYRLNVRLTARIHPLLRGHKYVLFFFLGSVCWPSMQTQNLYIQFKGIDKLLQVSSQYIVSKQNLNFDFTPTAKDSLRSEPIVYICGLRARIECEHRSEHSTRSDGVTNIGYRLASEASLCLRQIRN